MVKKISEINLNTVKEKLYSAVLSDTLDSIGMLNQALNPGIRPIDDTMVLCGWARIGLYFPIYHDDENVWARISSCTNYYRDGVGCRPIFRKYEHSWGNVLSTEAKGKLNEIPFKTWRASIN